MTRGRRHVLIFSLAFGAGAVQAWAAAAIWIGYLFNPGPAGPVWPALLLPPLVAIAGFAVIYAPLARLVLRLRFWVVSLVVVYGGVALGLWAVLAGQMRPPEALAAAAMVAYGAGLVLTGREVLRDADA